MTQQIWSYDEKRQKGATAILNKAKELALEAGIEVTWIGLDYGLEVRSRALHVFCLVIGERSGQLFLPDVVLVEFLTGPSSEITVSNINDLIIALNKSRGI